LEDQKKHRSKVVADEMRKAMSDEVSELKVKRRELQTDAEALILQIKQRNCTSYLLWRKQTACNEQQETRQTN